MVNFGNNIEEYIKASMSIINWDIVNQRIDKINSLKKD